MPVAKNKSVSITSGKLKPTFQKKKTPTKTSLIASWKKSAKKDFTKGGWNAWVKSKDFPNALEKKLIMEYPKNEAAEQRRIEKERTKNYEKQSSARVKNSKKRTEKRNK